MQDYPRHHPNTITFSIPPPSPTLPATSDKYVPNASLPFYGKQRVLPILALRAGPASGIPALPFHVWLKYRWRDLGAGEWVFRPLGRTAPWWRDWVTGVNL